MPVKQQLLAPPPIFGRGRAQRFCAAVDRSRSAVPGVASLPDAVSRDGRGGNDRARCKALLVTDDPAETPHLRE
jgi:hypothetical protein